MDDFSLRLRLADAFAADPTLAFWTPAYEHVLEWLSETLNPRSTVLELGCSTGLFLRALKQRGFNAVGLEVAEPAVERARFNGFSVWHGTVESAPKTWAEPDAIVAMFMLHHVPDPVVFLTAIRAKWPDAPIAIAQYGEMNRDPIRSQPPRAFTWWNPQALRTLLKASGYSALVRELPSGGTEGRPFRLAHAAIRPILPMLPPSLLRARNRFTFRLMPKVLAREKRDSWTLVAIGKPLSADEYLAYVPNLRSAEG